MVITRIHYLEDEQKSTITRVTAIEGGQKGMMDRLRGVGVYTHTMDTSSSMGSGSESGSGSGLNTSGLVAFPFFTVPFIFGKYNPMK